MITFVQGTLVSTGPVKAVVEAGGIGYEVNVPVTTTERLPREGSAVKFHTVAIYREDSQALYGFLTEQERDFFRLMIDHVNGVGPKGALSIMSRLSLPLLEAAIRAGDTKTLSKCPGIGPKTAERLVIELRGKLGGGASASGALLPGAAVDEGSSAHRDAVAALVALGYKPADADQSVRRAALALGAGATTEALIKKSLG